MTCCVKIERGKVSVTSVLDAAMCAKVRYDDKYTSWCMYDGFPTSLHLQKPPENSEGLS